MSRKDRNDEKWTIGSVIFFALACLVLLALTWYLLGLPESHFDVLKKRLSVIGGWFTAVVAYLGAEKLLKVKGAPSRVFALWPVRVLVGLGVLLSLLLLIPLHSIKVESDPEGAAVHLEGERGDKGNTPQTVAGLYARMYDLTFKKEGFEPQTRTVSLMEVLRHRTITVVLERQRGSLAVSSKPEGADVYINEETESRGRTPLVLDGLPAGFLTVVLQKDCYDDSVSNEVMIEPNGKTPLRVEMTQDDQPRYRLEIYSSPLGAKVFLNGIPYGTTNTNIQLPCETYDIVLKKGNKQKNYKVSIPEDKRISWVIDS